MKKWLILSLALSVPVFLPGPGPCGEREAVPPRPKERPAAETAKEACRTIAAILSVYPVLEVTTSEGPFPDPQGGQERRGCRVLAAGPASGMAGEASPGEAIRFLLGESGWEEDPRYSADGPGTTSFALRKGGALCLCGGGAHSWIEDGKIWVAERFEFDAGCAADPAHGTPAPDRRPTGGGPAR